nr:MAG TPA: hypothetical protein [Caudoviricetes sp.]
MDVSHTNHYNLFPSQAYERRRHRPQTLFEAFLRSIFNK